MTEPSSDSETLDAAEQRGPGRTHRPVQAAQLIGEGGFGTVFMAEQERAGPAPGGAEDHQAGDGHAGR